MNSKDKVDLNNETESKEKVDNEVKLNDEIEQKVDINSSNEYNSKKPDLNAIKQVRNLYKKLENFTVSKTKKVFETLQTKAKNGLKSVGKFIQRHKDDTAVKAVEMTLLCAVVFGTSLIEWRVSMDNQVKNLTNPQNNISISVQDDLYELRSASDIYNVNRRDPMENMEGIGSKIEIVSNIVNGMNNYIDSHRKIEENKDFGDTLGNRYQMIADLMEKEKQRKNKQAKDAEEKKKDFVSSHVNSSTSSNKKEDIAIVENIRKTRDFNVKMQDIDGDGQKDEVYTIKSKNIKGAKYEAVFLAKNKPLQVEEQETSKDVDDR